MAMQQELGRTAEILARTWLEQQGYEILDTNWRYGHLEVDLIARKDGLPHFIEVKYRSSARYGPPEIKVNRQKCRNLSNAAAAWLRSHPGYRDFRIDVLAITDRKGQEPEYYLIRNVFL